MPASDDVLLKNIIIYDCVNRASKVLLYLQISSK